MWVGIHGPHEILEAGNGPKTANVFSRAVPECFFSCRCKCSGNGEDPPMFFLVRSQMFFLRHARTRSWPGPGRQTTNQIRVPKCSRSGSGLLSGIQSTPGCDDPMHAAGWVMDAATCTQRASGVGLPRLDRTISQRRSPRGCVWSTRPACGSPWHSAMCGRACMGAGDSWTPQTETRFPETRSLLC